MLKEKKNSASINICIGEDLFNLLEMFCAVTGQSKTVAVERAIEEYCFQNSVSKTEQTSEKSFDV